MEGLTALGHEQKQHLRDRRECAHTETKPDSWSSRKETGLEGSITEARKGRGVKQLE